MSEATTKELTINRTFDAPRELVFRAWTDPELLAKWWGPRGVTNPECVVDPRVGGTFEIVMLAGDELGELTGQRWPMKGIFQEIREPEKIVFTSQAISEAGDVLIDGLTTVILEDVNGKTEMTMHTVATATALPALDMLQGMKAGWTQSIEKLNELLIAA